MFTESRRGRRRRLTEAVARRRYAALVAFYETDAPDWLADASPRRWARVRPFACGCRKARRGRPRVAVGMCCEGGRDRVYRRRAQVLDLRRLIARGEAADGDAVDRAADARCARRWE